MSDQALNASTVVPFPKSGDELDKAGQAACDMIRQAASKSEQQAQHVLTVAHKLALQLRAAEDRLADLQIELKHYRDRADRAEKWLHHISVEIEHNFFASSKTSQALTELDRYTRERQENNKILAPNIAARIDR